MDPALRALLDRREICDLTLRYARAADRRDYPAFEALFTEDAVLSGHRGDPNESEALYELTGRDAIVEAMRGLERYRATLHVVANQLVEIEDDEATGETYCTAHHVHDREGVEVDLTIAIRYQDRFRREGGRWRIAERRLVIDWERLLPVNLPANGEPLP